MKRRNRSIDRASLLKFAEVFLPLLVGIIVAWGWLWSTRHGLDFKVFYHASNLVLEGRGAEVYTDSPDLYLYGPGFAWLLTPFSWLPESYGLFLWNALKLLGLAWLIKEFRKKSIAHGLSPSAATIVTCLSILMVTRPLLIGFRYGQINLFLVIVALWTLWRRPEVRKEDPEWSLWRWTLLGVLATAKPILAPLLIVPFILSQGVPRKHRQMEMAGSLFGPLLILLLPVLTEGWGGAYDLVFAWKEALLQKGMPLLSHNQSFAAFLSHYFGNQPTHYIPRPHIPFDLSIVDIGTELRQGLSLAWFFLTFALWGTWLMRGEEESTGWWAAALISTPVIASHLVWKPYFVFSLPLAFYALLAIARTKDRKLSTRWSVWVAVAFVGMNLTSFELLGVETAAAVESASVFLWAHLILLSVAIRGRKK